MDKKVILSLCRFATPKLYKKEPSAISWGRFQPKLLLRVRPSAHRSTTPTAPDFPETIFFRRAGGCASPAFSGFVGGDFFSGGSAIRCRIPSSSATDEIVPKQNTDPGRRVILLWKVTAIELAWIVDTPPTWRASCRCFGSDRTPGVAPQGVFRSRTVSTTVAKWFVPIARGTVDKIYRFGPLRDA